MFTRIAVVAFVAFFAIGFGVAVLTPVTVSADESACDVDCAIFICKNDQGECIPPWNPLYYCSTFFDRLNPNDCVGPHTCDCILVACTCLQI